MISRRRIISRSLDQCSDYLGNYLPYDEEKTVWMTKEELFEDHIQEVFNKWEQIDDEIWAKIICMERNGRVAKAYARNTVLSIDGSDLGFDGYRIGLNGFDNPMRDPKTDAVKRLIGDGVKIRMSDTGNILIKRMAKSNVYIKCWQCDDYPEQTTSVSNDIIRQNGLLEYNKAVRLFDMKKFESNVSRELRRAYPDRHMLESQCICCIAFVKDSSDILDLPVWVMVINIVAIDFIKSKLLHTTISKRHSVPNFLSIFDGPKQSSDEDPYSIPGNYSSSSGSRSSEHYASTGRLTHQKSSIEPKPPKLPPRDFKRNRDNKGKSCGTLKSKNTPKPKEPTPTPDYEDNYCISQNSRQFDDPYYSGFSARVPNFGQRMPIASLAYRPKQYDQNIRKVQSNGFLNSYLKKIPEQQRTHSRYPPSYLSFYGSLESDPYTGSSGYEAQNYDNTFDPTYDRIGAANARQHPTHKRPNNALKTWALRPKQSRSQTEDQKERTGLYERLTLRFKPKIRGDNKHGTVNRLKKNIYGIFGI